MCRNCVALLAIGFAGSYLDASYAEFENVPCWTISGSEPVDRGGCIGRGTPTAFRDASGDNINFAPELAYNFNLDYHLPLGRSLEARGVLNINYSDGYPTSGDLDPDYASLEDFTKYDIRLSLGSADGLWDVALIGKNLTDEFTSGKKLWQQEVSSGAVAGPVSYAVDGEQYIAFNVGWGGAFPITFGALAQRTKVVPGSRLYVFKLSGKAPMPGVLRRELKPPSPPPLTADASALAEGKELFANHCGICHGLAAISADIIPDLRYLSEQQHEEFMPIVFGLRSHKGMPPFGGILKTKQVEQIQQYIIQRSHDLRAELAESSSTARKTQ